MTRFVLVPGAWHGGWAFDAVSDALSREGHEVQALTLSGLGDEPIAGVNLARHIDDVAQSICEGEGPVVLAGHSYGGMVITGAADKLPSRVQAIVYIDAYVPDSGTSTWSLTSPAYRERFIRGAAGDGLTCIPEAHHDKRRRRHPMACFVQVIELTGRWRDIRRKAYVAAHGWEGSPFLELYERLRLDPEWTTYSLDCAHDIPRLAPEALARILLNYA